MDIKKRLAAEHSKASTMAIVTYVGADKQRFRELITIFLKGEYRITQRAAWPLSYVCMAQPQLMKAYSAKLIAKLSEPGNHPAIIRNILRIFQNVDLPEKQRVPLLNACFAIIPNAAYPPAIRAFAITCAARICKLYSELGQELLLVLKDLDQQPQAPAIRQRIKLALKHL